MKRLLILRHAKSSWGNASLPDWERPLSERGITDAPRVGELLRERGLETYREILDVGQSDVAGEQIYRTYRIVIQHQAAIMITETFPCSVYQ